MRQGKISVAKTARYFVLGNTGEQTKNLWFVLHGYSQLASHFIQDFKELCDDHTTVVAPEGLSRYYKEGFSGRVSACWMTKEDRLDDIADYVRYLDHLAEEICSSCTNANIHILGFSQGGATASRWVSEGKVRARSLTLWACVFPPDLDFEVSAKKLDGMDVRLVVGNKDELISEERLQQHVNEVRNNKLPFELIRYAGNHSIDTATLMDLKTKLHS